MEERRGIGIGIITRGTTSTTWATHLVKVINEMPVSTFWKILSVSGKSYAEARIEVVKKARELNFEWIIFIDDDVFLPDQAITKLLSHQKEIISGIYWTKSNPSVPVISKKVGGGPFFNFPINKLFTIGSSGLGCCLINMKVFDKFDEENIPYFKENWSLIIDGNEFKCIIGEDLWFFHHARKLGFQPLCDSDICCDHVDMKTNISYPPPEVVRDIASKAIKQKTQIELLYNDPNKKTISFITETPATFAGDELEKRAVGGSETALINVAKILTKDFNVHVFCNCLREGIYDNVRYHNLDQRIILRDMKPDYFIVSRSTQHLKDDPKIVYNAKKVILWCHDLPFDINFSFFNEYWKFIDKIITVSNWHKNEIKSMFKDIPDDLFFPSTNGLDITRFNKEIKKVKGKCIYSSTPFRGLKNLLEMWPEIKKKVPFATLHVFSSMKLYGDGYDNDKYKDLYELCTKLDGVYYYGSIKQDELARHFMESELLLYPSIFPETCGITAIEAMAAECVPITSDLAALPETINECGIQIKGDPATKEFQDEFINEACNLLTELDKLKIYKEKCLKRDFRWESVIQSWKDNKILEV